MLVDIFCGSLNTSLSIATPDPDDFCKGFEKKWKDELLSDGKIKRVNNSTLSMSEAT